MLQLLAMRGQLGLMQQQVYLMDKQMRISVRPWVGIDDAKDGFIAEPIRFDSKGNAVVNYHLRTKNFGSYPAQNVLPIVELWPMAPLADVFQKEKDVCSRHAPEALGNALFPGNQRFATDTIAPFTMPDMQNLGVPLAQWYLFVCVVYRDQFGKVAYHSGYTYRFVQLNDLQRVIQFDPRGTYIGGGTDGQWTIFHGSID